MGSQNSRQPNSNPQDDLKFICIDIHKPVKLEFKALMNWSLQEIRQVYLTFTRLSPDCPFISKFLFKKIMLPLGKQCSHEIFDMFASASQHSVVLRQNNNQKRINAKATSTKAKSVKYVSFYQILCAVTLTSFNTYKRKLQFLYLLFDFRHQKTIRIKNFILMYESMVYGFCRLTGQQKLVPYDKLSEFLAEKYLKSETVDVQERPFAFRRLIEEATTNQTIHGLFAKFQREQIKENPIAFMSAGLRRYDKDQANRIFSITRKVYGKGNYEDMELIEQNQQLRIQKRRESSIRQIQQDQIKKMDSTNKFRIKNKVYSYDKAENGVKKNICFSGHLDSFPSAILTSTNLDNFLSNKKSTNYNSNQASFQQKQGLQKYRSTSLFDKIRVQPNNQGMFTPTKLEVQAQNLTQIKVNKNDRKKPTLVAIEGKAYTKTMFFQTIQYFNSLSNNKDEIKIKQFFKTFENKNFLKRQLSSLFKHFDKDNNGSISFQEFIKASYPGLKPETIQQLCKWNLDYKNIYQIDRLVKKKQKKNQIQLPKQTTERIRQIFNSFNGAKQNGYLTFQDLSKGYTIGYSIHQCKQIIKEFGVNGKLYVQGFARMLIPKGFVIQKCDWIGSKKQNKSFLRQNSYVQSQTATVPIKRFSTSLSKIGGKAQKKQLIKKSLSSVRQNTTDSKDYQPQQKGSYSQSKVSKKQKNTNQNVVNSKILQKYQNTETHTSKSNDKLLSSFKKQSQEQASSVPKDQKQIGNASQNNLKDNKTLYFSAAQLKQNSNQEEPYISKFNFLKGVTQEGSLFSKNQSESLYSQQFNFLNESKWVKRIDHFRAKKAS